MPDPTHFRLQQVLAGRYATEREVGRGGMGIVYLARDLALDRPVAIKLLLPELAAVGTFRARFLREARAAARLSHPHIVPIHAVEDHGDLVFFVMGYVDGETLGARVRRAGPLGRAEAIRLLQEVAWALGHAHALGLVHCDIKPDNILLERGTGRALVTDFGIVRHVDDGPGSEQAGTAAFMSPEQAGGQAVDARTDLYALGVTAFLALTGRLPFEADTPAAMLHHHLTAPAPPLASLRPDLPPGLAETVDRCLRKHPDDRLASADALVEALAMVRDRTGEPPALVAEFVREARAVTGDVGAAATATVVALVLRAAVFGDSMFAGFVFYPIAGLLAGVGVARLGELVLRVRSLLSQGYDHRMVRPAIVAEERREAAERLLPAGRPRTLTDRPGVVAVLGGLKTAAFTWLATLEPASLSILGVVGAIIVPTMTVRQIWRASRPAHGLWSRLMAGRVGRFLFRLGGLGVRSPALPAAGVPTAVFLGDAAERLYEALPPRQREAFAELPDLLARLRADALAAEADGAVGERRRADALAAIEAIRLDLLRLQAREGADNELTRDLERARELAERIDHDLRGLTP